MYFGRHSVTIKTTNFMLILCALLLLCISNGAAIKCFVCDSSDNPSCADLKTNSSIEAEECTLDKMKSIDTWLFELNKFAYFDTGANKSPLMNCQKVVARDPNTHKMVTARFCQLDTGDSDACSILRTKLRIPPDEAYMPNNDNANNNNNDNAWRNKQKEQAIEEQKFHCSICTSDRCNGSQRFVGFMNYVGSVAAAITTTTLMLLQKLAMNC